MSERDRLRTQVDTAAVLEQLQDLIWDPAIDVGKLRRTTGMLEHIAKQLRKDTHAVQKNGSSLPRRSMETLAFIRSYIEEHGAPPSIRDIQKGLRYKSSSSAAYQVRILLEAGYIVMPSRLARSMRLVEQPR